MPKTTTLVPITDSSGEAIAVGTEVSLDDETYAALRADGKVTASAEEVKAHAVEASPEGVYNARTGREDVANTKTEAPREDPKAAAKK